MKAKCIDNDMIIKRNYFLLMVVPLLIGFLISLTNFAHADWNNTKDPLLEKSPLKQGWKEGGFYPSPHHTPSRPHNRSGPSTR